MATKKQVTQSTKQAEPMVEIPLSVVLAYQLSAESLLDASRKLLMARADVDRREAADAYRVAYSRHDFCRATVLSRAEFAAMRAAEDRKP